MIDCIVFPVLLVFNVWNWTLAMKGMTTIDVVKYFSGKDNGKILRFKTFSDNLFTIFGTHKLLRVLSPSLRPGPFTGLEWSFLLRDEGYDCNGNKIEEEMTDV
jgi:hypothetical protein